MTNKPVSDEYIKKIQKIHHELGISDNYLTENLDKLFIEAEKSQLIYSGKDYANRDFFLIEEAFNSLKKMFQKSKLDNISLSVVSAFRSITYQKKLIEKKILAGFKINDIISVVAPPGFSEHHTGCAVDLTSNEETQVLTENFDRTKTYNWLCDHAEKFNFVLSFPKNNQKGFIYEPWHWCYQL